MTSVPDRVVKVDLGKVAEASEAMRRTLEAADAATGRHALPSIESLRADGWITRRDWARHLGVCTRHAGELLSRLVEDGTWERCEGRPLKGGAPPMMYRPKGKP